MHAAATWFMVGLVWVIQTVHYPLFAFVGESGFGGAHDLQLFRFDGFRESPGGLKLQTIEERLAPRGGHENQRVFAPGQQEEFNISNE